MRPFGRMDAAKSACTYLSRGRRQTAPVAFLLSLRRVKEGHDVKRVLVVLSDVAEETMSAMVKLAMTDEFIDIGQIAAAGKEAPRNAFVPVRIAELFLERWDLDAVRTPETDGSMRRRFDSASTWISTIACATS